MKIKALFTLVYFFWGIQLFAQNWSDPQVILNLEVREVELIADKEGGLSLFYQDHFKKNRFIFYDNNIWGSPIIFSDTISYIPTITFDDNNDLVAIWPQGEKVEPADLRPGISIDSLDLYISKWSGQNWSPPKLIYNSTLSAQFPQVILGNDGFLYLCWLDGYNDKGVDQQGHGPYKAGDIFTGKIVQEELTEIIQVSDRKQGGQSLSLGFDLNNQLHIIWQDPFVINQFHSIGMDNNWLPPQFIGTGFSPKMKSSRNGLLNLIYHGFFTSPNNVIYRKYEDQMWSEEYVISNRSDQNSKGQTGAVFSFGHKNRIIVVWLERFKDQGSKIYFSFNYKNNWIAQREIIATNSLFGPISMAIGNQNKLHIVWNDKDILKHIYAEIDTTKPEIEIFKPTLGDTVESGNYLEIDWLASDNDTIRETILYFSSDLGNEWTMIDSLTNSASNLRWLLPKIESNNCLVKIIVRDNWKNEREAISNTFSVINFPPEPAALLLPVLGDTLEPGDLIFKWTKPNDCFCDTLSYAINIFSSLQDTLISSLQDTIFQFSNSCWLKSDNKYSWLVFTTDQVDTTQSIDTLSFYIKNSSPSTVNLLEPIDNDTLTTDQILFRWSQSSDCDTLSYTIKIFNSTQDTLIASIPDTFLHFNGTNWVNLGNSYNWTVLVTDNKDTIAAQETFIFQVKK